MVTERLHGGPGCVSDRLPARSVTLRGGYVGAGTRGIGVNERCATACLCQSLLTEPADTTTYWVLLLPLRDSTAAFADRALWCTALLMLPNHDCFLLRVSDFSNAVRAGEPSSGILGAIFCSVG
jgi:hypothetical protein